MADWSDLFDDDMPGVVSVATPGGDTFAAHFYRGESPSSPWSEVGLGARLSQQPSPYLIAQDADLSDLAEQDALTIGTARWLIVRIDPLDDGLSKIALMLERTATIDSARWR